MNTLKSIAYYVYNKWVSFAAFLLALLIYEAIPSGTQFCEMAYAAVFVLGVIITAPFLRLLVFNEAAQYAESGGLDADLLGGKLTPAMIHYWIATVICYAAPIICFAATPK